MSNLQLSETRAVGTASGPSIAVLRSRRCLSSLRNHAPTLSRSVMTGRLTNTLEGRRLRERDSCVAIIAFSETSSRQFRERRLEGISRTVVTRAPVSEGRLPKNRHTCRRQDEGALERPPSPACSKTRRRALLLASRAFNAASLRRRF